MSKMKIVQKKWMKPQKKYSFKYSFREKNIYEKAQILEIIYLLFDVAFEKMVF